MKPFVQLAAFLLLSFVSVLYGGLAFEVCYGLLLEPYAVFPEMPYGMAVGVVLVSSFISEVGEIDHQKGLVDRIIETVVKSLIVPTLLMFIALVLSFIV
jgi:hypothetical protein